MTPLPVVAVPPEPLPATMLATLELMRLRAAVLVRGGAEDEAVAILGAGLVTAHRIGAIQGFLDDRRLLGAPALWNAARRSEVPMSDDDDEPLCPLGGTAYVEPLTDRERAVLEYMGTVCSRSASGSTYTGWGSPAAGSSARIPGRFTFDRWAAIVRAAPWRAEGRRFESGQPDDAAGAPRGGGSYTGWLASWS